MNLKFQKTVSLMMLVLFTISTIGVPVSKHICLESGHADVAFFTANYTGCCAEETGHCSPEQEQAKSCCDQQDQYYKLDTPKKHEEAQQLVLDVSFELPYILSYVLQGEELPTESLHFITDSSPPPTPGTDILVNHQVFRL